MQGNGLILVGNNYPCGKNYITKNKLSMDLSPLKGYYKKGQGIVLWEVNYHKDKEDITSGRNCLNCNSGKELSHWKGVVTNKSNCHIGKEFSHWKGIVTLERNCHIGKELSDRKEFVAFERNCHIQKELSH